MYRRSKWTVLVQHDAVLEAAVVGVDHGGLVKTRAFAALKREFTPSEILADELKAFVKGRLAPHKYPRDILFVDDLPKTATGKIQRFKICANCHKVIHAEPHNHGRC